MGKGGATLMHSRTRPYQGRLTSTKHCTFHKRPFASTTSEHIMCSDSGKKKLPY